MAASRIHPIEASGGRVLRVRLDGKALEAREGEPLAATMLGAGIEVFARSQKYHRPRGAPCGRGHCFQCLVRVDGQPNKRSCLQPVHEGMQVQRQNVLGSAKHDLLAATDWLFPRGLNHHEMFTGVPLLRPVVQKFVRKLSGLGTLPDALPVDPAGPGQALLEAPPRQHRTLVIVGAGSSGSALARATHQAGLNPLLIEGSGQLGGRGCPPLHAELEPLPEALELWTRSSVEWISGEGEALTLLVHREGQLRQLEARAVVLATGTTTANPLFENNDLPGLYDARWAAELLHRHDVLVGRRLVLCAEATICEQLQALFEAAGAEIVATLPASAALARGDTRVVAAEGGTSLESLSVEQSGTLRTLHCDALVHALPGHPSLDLAQSAGVSLRYAPTAASFLAHCTALGATTRPGLFATGSLVGRMDPMESADQGRQTAEAVGHYLKEQGHAA